MSKKINIMGKDLFEVKIDNVNDPIHICTIENVGRDEYHAYNDKGEGFSVAQLDTIDVIELMITGSIERSYYEVKPI